MFAFALDENRLIVDKLDLIIKPDDGVYSVTVGALSVNKIDLVEHDKKAIKQSEAKTKFLDFLSKHSQFQSNKLKLISHNTAFDKNWLQTKFLPITEWENYFSRRPIDTQTTAVFLQEAGKLPPTITCALTSLAEYFCIDQSGAHTARGDCEMTYSVYLRLLEIVQ